MALIQNAQGAQFWAKVNARLEAVKHSVDEIHYICPELAISTLRKWQSKNALPAKEHIKLIENCLLDWENATPENVNEVQAGENPMVVNTNEVENLKAKINELLNQNRSHKQKLNFANKTIAKLGGKPIEGDFNVPSDDERVKELEEMVQARDIEIENMRKQVELANDNLMNAVEANQALTEELEDAKRGLKDAVSDIERLEGNLMNTSELLKEANEEVEKIKAIAKEYVDEVEERNRRIQLLEADLESLRATCNDERNCVNEMLVKPSYYLKGSIECKELIAIMLEDVSGIQAFNLGNALKYLWRWQGKNGAEDISKAITYLEELKNGISKQTTAQG